MCRCDVQESVRTPGVTPPPGKNIPIVPVGMSRKGKVFGRFSGYSRHASPDDPASPKREGTGGADICAKSSRKTNVCEVRTHVCVWRVGGEGYGEGDGAQSLRS